MFSIAPEHTGPGFALFGGEEGVSQNTKKEAGKERGKEQKYPLSEELPSGAHGTYGKGLKDHHSLKSIEGTFPFRGYWPLGGSDRGGSLLLAGIEARGEEPGASM